MDAFPHYYETATDILRRHGVSLNISILTNNEVNYYCCAKKGRTYYDFVRRMTNQDYYRENEWIQGLFTNQEGKLLALYIPYNSHQNIYDEFFDYFTDERNLWDAFEFIEFHDACPDVDTRFTTAFHYLSLGTEIKEFFDHADIVLTLDHLISEFRSPSVRRILNKLFD